MKSSICFTASLLLFLMRGGNCVGDGVLVSAINELYGKDDSGVLIRTVEVEWNWPWLNCEDHSDPACVVPKHAMSFSVLNRNAWDSVREELSLWTTDTSFGYIAIDNVTHHHLQCVFFADGDTMFRGATGCGPSKWGHGGWCDPVPTDPIHAWIGDRDQVTRFHEAVWDGCSMRGSDLTDMLHIFKAIKDATSVCCGMSSGAHIDTHSSYNEVIVDGEVWNQNLAGFLWAFVLPEACGQNPTCRGNFRKQYKQFEAAYGPKPILGFNPANRDFPFYSISEGPRPSPSPLPTSSPTSLPTSFAIGQCCYAGCGVSCQSGWCGQSRHNCEGDCKGQWCHSQADIVDMVI